jgi:UPF0755 protein
MRRAALLLALLLGVSACNPAPSGPKLRVHVLPGSSFSQIADTLKARGIIGNKTVFKIFARVTNAQTRAKPGTYGFRKGEPWTTVLSDLRNGNVLKDRLVIPEGWSLDKIAARMARFSEVDSTTILNLLLDTAQVRRTGVPGPTLEGYLYPATYEFAVDIPLDSMISRLVARYRAVWTAARRALADSLKMSEREVVTLASIVEKEAKRRAELPTIASVYHNRLRIGLPLQADPTVQYALGTHRERLLYSDLRLVERNPYNTYRIRGLPPGPIGSPSAFAIDAVLQPANTKYIYFVAQPDGSHVFTRTLDEHNRAKRAARAAWSAAQNAAGKPPTSAND